MAVVITEKDIRRELITGNGKESMYRTAGMRVGESRRFSNEAFADPHFSRFASWEEKDWLQMKSEDNEDLKVYNRLLFLRTHRLFAEDMTEEQQESSKMNADKGLMQHLLIFEGVLGQLCHYGLLDLYPEGTTQTFVESAAWAHELSRIFGVNGRFPVNYTDQVSDGQLTKIFKKYPASYIHDIGPMIGTKELIDPDHTDNQGTIQAILKYADTTAKADGNPDEFEKRIDSWAERQKGKDSFPLHIFQAVPEAVDQRREELRPREIREVSAQEYAQKDKQQARAGYIAVKRLLEKASRERGIHPPLDFVQDIYEPVVRHVLAHPELVEVYGRLKDEEEQEALDKKFLAAA